MENDVKEFLSELLKQLKSIDYIKPEDIPNIDLYMDQVTTFMDEQLAASSHSFESSTQFVIFLSTTTSSAPGCTHELSIEFPYKRNVSA